MQFAFDFGVPSALEQVREMLLVHFGPQRVSLAQRLDPMSQLIRSMLGCRTRDEVSWPVFDSLRDWCGGDWERLRAVEPDRLSKAIGAVTYPEDKAQHILKTLQILKARHGSLRLEFLAGWPVEQALQRLHDLPGVGPKVRAATLNFSTLRLRILVVDTHVWRVSQRLGLIGRHVDADAAPQALMRQVPNDWDADDLTECHRLLKLLGQQFCTHSYPDCSHCPVRNLCPQELIPPSNEP